MPGLYKSIFANPGNLTCGPLINAFSGCTLGGNSAINAGLFFEPPASDYDLYFPQGWKSKDMQNATRRVYAAQPSTNITSLDNQRYLQSGYNAAQKWLANGLGYQEVDINQHANDKTEVFGHPIWAVENGQRSGPAVSYLQDVLPRSNFRLQLNTRVLRVERSSKRATGVTVLLPDNRNITLFLRSTSSRVILSAGAIFTPSVLMHSGIGPLPELELLRAAGRLAPSLNSTKTLIVNNATGLGLFDNPNTFIELSAPTIESFTYTYNVSSAQASQYLNQKSGPYTFASQTTVFWDTMTRPNGSVAAFQGTIDSAGYGAFTNSSTVTLNIYGTSGLKSSGRVVLDKKFVPGPSGSVLYSDPQDAKDIAAYIYKIFQGLPRSNSGLTPLNLAQNSTVAQIEKYITTGSQYARGFVNHWSSSCRIGKCVDANLKVIGVDGLYVMDASVLEPLTTNPMFGVMVAAEKGIEGILRGLKKWVDV